MKIIGYDLHARQQRLAMLDTTTSEIAKATLRHEGNVREGVLFQPPRPVRVGTEATGSMQWSGSRGNGRYRRPKLYSP